MLSNSVLLSTSIVLFSNTWSTPHITFNFYVYNTVQDFNLVTLASRTFNRKVFPRKKNKYVVQGWENRAGWNPLESVLSKKMQKGAAGFIYTWNLCLEILKWVSLGDSNRKKGEEGWFFSVKGASSLHSLSRSPVSFNISRLLRGRKGGRLY